MCIRCNSNQEDFRIYGRGSLCEKCRIEWGKLYFSQGKAVRFNAEKIWGENGLWEQFMEGAREKVIFT